MTDHKAGPPAHREEHPPSKISTPDLEAAEARIFADIESAIQGLRDESVEPAPLPKAVGGRAQAAPPTGGAKRAPTEASPPKSKVNRLETSGDVRKAPVIEGEAGGPLIARPKPAHPTPANNDPSTEAESKLQKKTSQTNFRTALAQTQLKVRRNLAVVFAFTIMTNILVLAIPIYLFQISDRVLTSRSLDTLVMLTIIVVGAIVGQVVLDVFRRIILMRTAVEVEARLSSPILSAAARSALNGSGKDYQILGDLQHIRSFLTGATLLAILDAPLAPLFILAVWLVHPQLGYIVMIAVLILLVIAYFNKRATAQPFAEATGYSVRSNMTLDALARNSQIVNALGMIPEAVRMWGRDNASSLKAQVSAQDRNVVFSGLSKAARLTTQVAMLGWGAYLALDGQLTGGMVIASSIIASRALGPVEGTIEGWRTYMQSRSAYGRITHLLLNSPLNVDRLRLPSPQGRLDVDRILYVPPPTKKVILNGVSFSLKPGEVLGIIGSSGAGKSTIGRMLVGSIVPTAGNVRLDLMDLKNWDPRQLGESIGYLPQDVQLFPASIKANIARMRDDASDDMVFEAAMLADIHELVASFPQGYETIISGDGAPLSGGQKQRIGLARAFFGNPRLVVLDEPNSNLDTDGEKALALAITKAKQRGTTVVAITQRHSLLRCVDRIMIMDKGAVSAIGERNKMMALITGQKPSGQGHEVAAKEARA